MKTVDVTHATNSLESYARELGEEPLVLTEGGRAIAALVPVDDDDVTSMKLSLSPKFQAIIDRARAEYHSGASVSADEARRELEANGSDEHNERSIAP
jgi:hypothetical protein